AYYKLNGVQQTAEAGATIVMPPRHVQVHPWNAGETALIYRQRDTFGQPNAQAVQDVLGVFATLARLARDGKVDRRGLPRDPLQLAITARMLGQYGGYDASLPVPVQRLLAATVGRLAGAVGYQAVHARDVGES